MKVLSRSILLFALVVFFGATSGPDVISKEHVSEKVNVNGIYLYFRAQALRGRKVPYFLLHLSRMYFQGTGAVQDRNQAENWLRVFVLQLNEEELDKHRVFMSENGWNAEFQKAFGKAAAWRESLGKRTPEDVYRLAQTYFESARRQPTQEKKESHNVLAEHILALAAVPRYLRARSDLIRRDLSKIDESWREIGQKLLWFVVNEGDYAPAQIELSDRYYFGWGLPQSYTKAYYWLLRARAHGAGDERSIRGLARKLSPAERQRVAGWISSKQAPDP